MDRSDFVFAAILLIIFILSIRIMPNAIECYLKKDNEYGKKQIEYYRNYYEINEYDNN